MKKDNFDLRSFLSENRLTENSRGDEGRYHFDGSQNNTGRARILNEMRIPADGVNGSEAPYAGDEDYEDDPYGNTGLGECGDVPSDRTDDTLMDECGDMDLEEAGYTDDDNMDFGDEDDMAMMDLIRKDRGAAKAKKAAQKDLGADAGNDPDPADMDATDDAPAIDPEDMDAAAGETDPNAETQYGLASQIQHTPTVEFEMDDEELDEYLSQFRRPQVAVNVLNRAIRGAQREVNDSALDSLYIVLKNGFYETSRFQSGKIIAKVHKEQGAADTEA